MTNEVIEPVTFTPKQQQYLSSTARFLLYGGGAGGGKTHVAIFDMLGLNNPGNGRRAIDVPEYTGLFLRRTMPQLREVIRRTQEIYPTWGRCDKTGKEPRWYEQKKVWVFPSGAHIFFGYIDRFDDVYNYQGWEYQTICFEELTQWPTADAFLYLHSRLRKTTGNPVHLGMRATCNPGGVGHQWVRRFWQISDAGDPTRFNVPTEIELNGEAQVIELERQFIPSLLDENPFLSQAEYAAALEDPSQSEQMKRALRYGRWDVVDVRGMVFAEQLNRIHNENRVREVPYNDRYPVQTFWDLGTSDQCAIWFHQRIDGIDRFIDYEEASNRSLKDWWKELMLKPYNYGCHYVPHDALQRKHNLGGTISTIYDIMEDLGMRRVEVVPRTSFLQQSIEQARIVLPACLFDGHKTSRGVECLTNYRFAVKSDGSVSQKPAHDQFSHGADAFRQFAQAHDLIDDGIAEYDHSEDDDGSATPWSRRSARTPDRRRWVV